MPSWMFTLTATKNITVKFYFSPTYKKELDSIIPWNCQQLGSFKAMYCTGNTKLQFYKRLITPRWNNANIFKVYDVR